MRQILIVALLLGLAGCGDNLSDVRQFVQTTQDAYRPKPEPLPEIPEFSHIPYTANVVRSPFVEPVPELIEVQIAQRKDCLTPNPTRLRHPLESFALDDIKMRGTLGDNNRLFGLVQANDGNIYQVQLNDYLGLFHGRVVSVTPRKILLEEMVPEGDGCWAKRTNKIELISG
ncbi:pilus assembly protein PilP [Neiella marina]|uniref:Pilus assembly protein PilP n=1 Tax=Neiella holothuriorum TaxID=2870530 RepID=A0ABS7ECN8_9GAMM|nr:pilus assembly protein PilP [Neiella holothuriorum]MBW8190020.1 pilus assembly protein PilP [Neiella holothuriorum]